MARRQPHHLVAGLQGGYSPNIVEHYDTKTAALDALRDHAAQVADWFYEVETSGRPYVGSVRDGLIQYRPDNYGSGYHDYAMIEPCPDPEGCEAKEEQW